MASSRAPRWKCILRRFAPYLFKICPAGNYHWRWDTVCYCMMNEYSGDKGGLYVFKIKAWFDIRTTAKYGRSYLWLGT